MVADLRVWLNKKNKKQKLVCWNLNYIIKQVREGNDFHPNKNEPFLASVRYEKSEILKRENNKLLQYEWIN